MRTHLLLPPLRSRLKLPTPYRQRQRVTFAVSSGKFLIGLVLQSNVLRDALPAFEKRRRHAGADGATSIRLPVAADNKIGR